MNAPSHVNPSPTGQIPIPVEDAIGFVAEQGAAKAVQNARERLNFFLTLLSIFGGAIVAAAVMAGTYFIETTVEGRVAEKVESIQKSNAHLIETGFAKIKNDNMRPALVVAEASSLSRDKEYTVDRADFLLSEVELLSTSFKELNGNSKRLAYRLVEVTADNFMSAGDFYRVERIHEIFGADLVAYDGTLSTLAITVAMSHFIEADQGRRNTEVEAQVLGAKADPNWNAAEYIRVAHLTKFALENLDNPEAVSSKVKAELARNSALPEALQQITGAIRAMILNEPDRIGPNGQKMLDMLI